MGPSKASEALVEVEEGPRDGGQARDMPPSYSGLEVAMGDRQPPCYQVMGGEASILTFSIIFCTGCDGHGDNR